MSLWSWLKSSSQHIGHSDVSANLIFFCNFHYALHLFWNTIDMPESRSFLLIFFIGLKINYLLFLNKLTKNGNLMYRIYRIKTNVFFYTVTRVLCSWRDQSTVNPQYTRIWNHNSLIKHIYGYGLRCYCFLQDCLLNYLVILCKLSIYSLSME